MTINVTKTFLPPLEEYVEYLEGIWARGQVTNHGPLVLELEQRLQEMLQAKHVILVANGTIALQIAIRALEIKDSAVTTPFSYVATTSSLVWEGCRVIFADIEPDSLCIAPQAITAAITPDTRAIVATHVYGNPCDVERIREIAAVHDLRVIYDAAHAFGVRYQGRSLTTFGDIATLSFHATKLFHAVEGGALVTDDDALAHRIRYMRNFGHNGQEAYWGLGINGKLSELHAAMGLAVLKHVPALIASRRASSEHYDKLLSALPVKKPGLRAGTEYNYAYYPLLLESEEALLRVKDRLNAADIYPRRYFYPALNLLPYFDGISCPIAEDASRRVLCLPLFPGQTSQDVETVVVEVRKAI
jgi:dTDP-4-amino-4,6-dideoxygalactose transaminase